MKEVEAGALESILIVYLNPWPGHQDAFDEWYTNIHIRDAMRLDGAIATQRFIVDDTQPFIDGELVSPNYWAHTIYEWESAQKSVDGHNARLGSPTMEISQSCCFKGLRDYFYRPEFLSHGWSREEGFRRGTYVLTALFIPKPGSETTFRDWFVDKHAPETLALEGFGSVGLFSLHEAQSLSVPAEFPMVAIYGLTDRNAALSAWARRHDAKSGHDLSSQTSKIEIGCWQPRIERLRAEDVVRPSSSALAQEQEVRRNHAGSYLTIEELSRALAEI